MAFTGVSEFIATPMDRLSTGVIRSVSLQPLRRRRQQNRPQRLHQHRRRQQRLSAVIIMASIFRQAGRYQEDKTGEVTGVSECTAVKMAKF